MKLKFHVDIYRVKAPPPLRVRSAVCLSGITTNNDEESSLFVPLTGVPFSAEGVNLNYGMTLPVSLKALG